MGHGGDLPITRISTYIIDIRKRPETLAYFVMVREQPENSPELWTVYNDVGHESSPEVNLIVP